MLVDSHCHLNHLDLGEFNQNMENVFKEASLNDVGHMLSVCVDLNDYPVLVKLAERYPSISISVGLHPNETIEKEPDVERLVALAAHEKCIAIGETGLDYYRVLDEKDQENQKNRFRVHIQSALESGKPLIIHTRSAADDTLRLMAEEQASRIGGVMHCFSESWEIAKRAMDLNFYISLSGIVTFKNAMELQTLAQKIPLERLLIETDAPYLAPVPFRGKQNHPALVKHVALEIARLRGMDYEDIARQTTENFCRCFKIGDL